METSFRQHCLNGTTSEDDARLCLIIGEVAQTHDWSLGLAHAFIDAIADAGADAVKFQTHIAAAESTPGEPWRVKFSRQDESRFDYWRRMEFSPEQWAGLKMHAEERGLLFLSTPFSNQAFDLLRRIGTHVWKVGSGEIGNIPLLDEISATEQPVILSSGMSDWTELDTAVSLFTRNALAVVQCTTEYPCSPEKIGLNVMNDIRERYRCATGLSDHSGKIYAGFAAAALGAEVLEVHVALSREMFGPDVSSSVTTPELRQLVDGVREIETMLANPVEKSRAADEMQPLRMLFTKSLYTTEFLPKGTVLEKFHFQLKKPGIGISAVDIPAVVGKKLRRNLEAGELLRRDDVEL